MRRPSRTARWPTSATRCCPRLVAGGTAVQHRLESYWRDVGTLDAYWSAHRDLLGDPPRLDLDDPGWPIRSHGGQRPPARLRPGAEVEDSLVSPACVVYGSVRGSVLGPGVVVEPGASVVDSVVLADTVVRSGAAVDRAILDERTEVGADARVGRAGAGITVTGRGAELAAGTEFASEEEQ